MRVVTVILIGHSNGGLVSRYYIENMNGYDNVDKLITIDTPHYGSGLGDAATFLFQLGVTSFPGFKIVPLDVELSLNSRLFTDKTVDLDSPISQIANLGTYMGLLCMAVGLPYGWIAGLAYIGYRTFTYGTWKEMYDYIQENQSPKLNGNNGDGIPDEFKTKYYAIGGLVSSWDDLSNDMTCHFEFDLDTSSVEAFHNSINSASIYQVTFPSMAGDNVVGIKSQFGLKSDGNRISEHVQFDKTSIFMSFKSDIYYLYHVDILEDSQMHDTVLKYVDD